MLVVEGDRIRRRFSVSRPLSPPLRPRAGVRFAIVLTPLPARLFELFVALTDGRDELVVGAAELQYVKNHGNASYPVHINNHTIDVPWKSCGAFPRGIYLPFMTETKM